MRGKGNEIVANIIANGITPAYAGKRIHHDRLNAVIRDHPRLCGEKSESPVCLNVKSGSPPPMRGKGELPCPVDRSDGITPAYAGKSLFSVRVLRLL